MNICILTNKKSFSLQKKHLPKTKSYSYTERMHIELATSQICTSNKKERKYYHKSVSQTEFFKQVKKSLSRPLSLTFKYKRYTSILGHPLYNGSWSRVYGKYKYQQSMSWTTKLYLRDIKAKIKRAYL